MRALKRQYSKKRKKRQFEETDFLTFWSDIFNFANLGPGEYFDDTTYTGGAGLNILGTLALTGTFGGAMMAGMPNPSFQVCLFPNEVLTDDSDFSQEHFSKGNFSQNCSVTECIRIFR